MSLALHATLASLASSVLLGLSLNTAALTPAAPTMTTSASLFADTYFACPSGYHFEVDSNAARCVKPAGEVRTALTACLALVPRTDHVGNTDMCVGSSPITGEVAVERSCPLGFNKRIVPGIDVCEQPTPGDIAPPSIRVSR